MTFSNVCGITSPTPFVDAKTYPVLKEEGLDPLLMYGVELEIENLGSYDNFPDGLYVPGISGTNDGSLRNSGWEFITLPMRFNMLSQVLRKFYVKNKFTEKNYSDRTSIHVHVNVLDLTHEQIQTLFLLYLTFEPILFEWVGGERKDNIFCVPWSQTNISSQLLGQVPSDAYLGKVKRWQKYTALNLLPMWEIGTVEFRHMVGTPELGRVITWCDIIGGIVAYARTNKYEDVLKELSSLNSTSRYHNIVSSVFKQYSSQFTSSANFLHHMEEGAMFVKYLTFPKKLSSTASKKPLNRDALMDAAHARAVAQNDLVARINWDAVRAQAGANITWEQVVRPVRVDWRNADVAVFDELDDNAQASF